MRSEQSHFLNFLLGTRLKTMDHEGGRRYSKTCRRFHPAGTVQHPNVCNEYQNKFLEYLETIPEDRIPKLLFQYKPKGRKRQGRRETEAKVLILTNRKGQELNSMITMNTYLVSVSL
jgi:hypothetical protein